MEEPYELPDGWVWATIGDISNIIHYGYTASSTTEPIGPKMLRITDIQNNSVNWKNVPYCQIKPGEKQKYLLNEGDLVFARTGATVGKSFLINANIPEAVFASYLIRIIISHFFKKEYVAYFFHSNFYWLQIYKGQIGIGQPNVNSKTLSKIQISLPPLAEQHRIVAKLEALLAQVNRSKDHLAKVPLLIKRFRQSVLAAACSGRLTEDWRREHPDVEPALELLNRIREERIRGYEEECQKAEAEGRRKPKKPKNLEPQVVGTGGLPELPEGWVWTTIGAVSEKIHYGSAEINA